jgi:hypothetical protein
MRASAKMNRLRKKICVPVPTNAQNSDLLGGKRKTSPWMYFQPDSSSSMAAAAVRNQVQGS